MCISQYKPGGGIRTIPVPSLNARIPERGAFKAQLGVKPLQEVDFTQVKYGEYTMKRKD